MTLSTGTSENDRAELMSSPRSAVSSPSSVMFSMMSASSSSVTVTAGSLCTRRATALPKAVSRADRGLKSTMKNRSERAVRMASRSAYFLAMLFGSISPAKNTTTVVTSVPAVTAHMPHCRCTATVTSVAIVRCRMFVPISSVVIA